MQQTVRSGQNHIAVLECGSEFLSDAALYQLCLFIISIIETGTQHKCTQHNAALDFIAETFTSGFLVHIGQTIVIFSTETVLHAVETSQVGGCLSRCDDVVGVDRIFCAGQ